MGRLFYVLSPVKVYLVSVCSFDGGGGAVHAVGCGYRVFGAGSGFCLG